MLIIEHKLESYKKDYIYNAQDLELSNISERNNFDKAQTIKI